MVYMNFGSEVVTDSLARHALRYGKALLLPKINHREKTLDVYEVQNLDRDLEEGLWGIREPIPELCAAGDPRAAGFILVPGVAFDARGGRLGYGGGFYDKLLSDLLSANPYLVAAAFETQMVERVPSEEHDVPMDLIVTESSRYPHVPPSG